MRPVLRNVGVDHARRTVRAMRLPLRYSIIIVLDDYSFSQRLRPPYNCSTRCIRSVLPDLYSRFHSGIHIAFLVVVLYYDYTLTFATEVERYWGRKTFTLPSLAFLIYRYVAILGHLPLLYEAVVFSINAQRVVRTHSGYVPHWTFHRRRNTHIGHVRFIINY